MRTERPDEAFGAKSLTETRITRAGLVCGALIDRVRQEAYELHTTSTNAFTHKNWVSALTRDDLAYPGASNQG